jgi:hypothetical protein
MRNGAHLLALLALWGCSASEDKAPGVAGDTCKASGSAARERVMAVVAANLSCGNDSDCVTINVNATCFDGCSQNVNLTGKGAVDRASTLVEASECKAFAASHCTLTSPPCAPPAPPHCVSGKCQ